MSVPIPLIKLPCALPSFGDWIGDVMGQFPMNFSDVKPDFTLQVPNNSGNVSSTSGTRKVGYPFHQNVGILTPRVPQHNIPYNPGPQQPHVNNSFHICDIEMVSLIHRLFSWSNSVNIHHG